MEPVDWDLVVVGGGPGGSCAAAFARLSGLSVCVVEKESFPRFRIGESLLPMGNAVLEAAGVWPKVEAAGFVRKLGAEFILGDGSDEKEIVFAEGYVPGLGSTFQVERSRFDLILLEHARALGAQVRAGCTVRALEPSADHVKVTLSEGGRPASTLSARWVIDSGGRDNLYESALKRDCIRPFFPKRAAVYSHFEGVQRAAGPKGGNIRIVRIEDGWFWIIPIGADRTSVGLVTSIGNLRDGPDPQRVFADTVAASPRLKEIMGGSRAVEPFRVTADYSYCRREFASPRIVLSGDAAAFFDPIFSSGVYLSTYSAQIAVGAIVAAHARGRSLSAFERRRYTRRIKAHCAPFRELISVFYNNDSFSVFMTQKPPLDLNRGLISIVAGHSRLTWPLWWRFKVFLAVCRIQRFVPLVKRIEHNARVSLRPA